MNAVTRITADHSGIVEQRSGLGTQQRLAVKGLVAALDAAIIYGAFLAACLLYGLGAVHPTMDFAVLAAGICVVIAGMSGGYGDGALVRPIFLAACGLRAVFYTGTAVVALLFAVKASQDVSRIAFLLGACLAASGVCAMRMLAARQIRRVAGGHCERILLIEDGRTCPGLAWSRRVDAAAMAMRPDSDDPLMLDRIGMTVRGMDRVVVACCPDRREAWAGVLKGFGARGEVVEERVDALGAIGAGRAGPHGTLIVAAHPLPMHCRILKRLFDIVFAMAALLLAAPVMAVVALAILIEDGRPVFFRQNRVGQGNCGFAMVKFRSMYKAQCDVAADRLTSRGDARVTRVGRFIRATSLDELPQLINVLAGNMSIVGPRPHAAMAKAGAKLYWQVDRRYWNRHAVKPGLTGLAQVRGFRGATDVEGDLRNRLGADLEYLSGWSIWRDMRIVAQTARVLVHPQAF